VELSRDSLVGQRKVCSFPVEGIHAGMDGGIEAVGIREGLMGQMVCLEIAPDAFDIIEFRRVLWQPLDG
jgi:hypothetical protein